MNVLKLTEGQIIKNYNELCLLLGIAPTKGKGRQYHIKELERYCEYKKQGQKFIIENVYNTPLPQIDKRSNGNHSIYIDDITDILVNYIYDNMDVENKVTLSFSRLINILGLVNNTYTIGNTRKKELSDLLNIQLQAIHYFYNTSRSEFKRIITTALNNLKKRSIIKYEEKIMVCKSTFINGEKTKIYKLATSDEVSLLLDAQSLALEELGIKDLTELFLKGAGVYKEFIKITMSELPQDWIFYFNVYEIVYGKNAITKEYSIINERKLSLNNKAVNKLNTVMATKTDKDNEKKLIDVLVDLLNHDMSLDDKLIKMYEDNNDKKYKLIEEKAKEINEIRTKETSLTMDIMQISDEYDNRDSISKYDYYRYCSDMKNKRQTNNFMETFGLDEKDLLELDDIF